MDKRASNGNAGSTPEGRSVRCDHLSSLRTLTTPASHGTVRVVFRLSGRIQVLARSERCRHKEGPLRADTRLWAFRLWRG
jgi:hypothetical protein